jgi:protein-S-isoprenylcysteine O-methyltransferase Ste14
MTRQRELLGWLVTTTALAAVTALFALAHFSYWRRTGDPKGMCFAAQETAVVLVAITRRRPSAVSRRPFDWICAVLGSYAVLLLRPGGHAPAALAHAGTALQLVGAAAAAACVFTLGRSFGVVAANRGIASRGPYRIVRHPLYAAYIVAMTGYTLASPTVWNIAIVAVSITLQWQRMRAEEAVLTASSEYRAYARSVPWRLIPRVV